MLGTFQRFFSTSAAGSWVLLTATCVALAWANSPWAESYHHLWEATAGVGLTLTLHQWVNDGLMATFFLLVGLEIKREVLVGELASRRTAALPVAAAIGGMVVPALLYAAVNGSGPGTAGWGVPMATDIAFALGILALLGTGVPTGLRVFLAALAIADDLGAVLVIAIFYTSALNFVAVGGAMAALAVLVWFNRAGVQRLLPYALVGLVLWVFVLKSGIHATIAGVVLALTIPAGMGRSDFARAPLQRLEHMLQRYVAFGVVPLFALANAGVPLRSGVGESIRSPIALGIVLGLLVGKPLGIMLASYAVVRAGVADLPAGVAWRHVHGAAWLGGIGFTMSLFIAALAFPAQDLLDTAKLGILGASFLAGVVGYALLAIARRPQG